MGFEVVAYGELVKGVKLSIEKLFESKGLEKLSQTEALKRLSDERRIQVQLLLTMTDLLDKSNIDIKEKARVLNAMVYYVRDKIAQTYGYMKPEGSVLYTELTAALGLKLDEKLSDDAVVKLYMPLSKSIRSYVYNSSDPIKGYQQNSPFSKEKIKGYSVEDDIKNLNIITCDKLNQLVDVAYKLEQKKGKKPSSTIKEKVLNIQSLDKEFSDSIMTKSLKLAINNYFIEKKIDKLGQKEALSKLSDARRINVQLLLTTIELLGNASLKSEEKVRILKGMAYYIREQIGNTYSYSKILYSELTKALGLKMDEKLPNDVVVKLYVSLEKFICNYVYVSKDPVKGYLHDSAFSDERIKGYLVEDDIKNLNKITCTMLNEQVDIAFKLKSKEVKTSSSTLFKNLDVSSKEILDGNSFHI